MFSFWIKLRLLKTFFKKTILNKQEFISKAIFYSGIKNVFIFLWQLRKIRYKQNICIRVWILGSNLSISHYFSISSLNRTITYEYCTINFKVNMKFYQFLWRIESLLVCMCNLQLIYESMISKTDLPLGFEEYMYLKYAYKFIKSLYSILKI